MNISAQLLADCQRGDRRAQFQLYQSCFSTLMSVGMRYKKDESESAAVVNVAFLKILKNLDKYQTKAPFQAWIRRIMINTVIDEFRKNRKVRELIEHTDFEDFHNHDDLVTLNVADLNFDAEELENMIKRLPPVSQKVFNLFAIDGFSHKEIGTMLGISDGTSKWHLSFSRKKLKEFIEAAMKEEVRKKAHR
jgi:RNA polymerase sigma-70 factor (ECF subfamily)